ncbi:SAM-dependent methyltransferase [Streptomyces sp. NPDC001356]
MDPARPAALVLSGLPGHVAGQGRARPIAGRLMSALAPGSRLCVNDRARGVDPVSERAQEAYDDSGAVPYNPRTVEATTSIFDVPHLVGPGVLPAHRWCPEPGPPAPKDVAEHGGPARKR